MKIDQIEIWKCHRNQNLFDDSRTAGSVMPWDVVPIRITTDTGVEGVASALATRSANITADYLTEIIAPVFLGRDATDREAIYQDLWDLDRYLTFFPVFLPGPIDVALWDIAAKAADLPLFRYLGACRTSLPVYASSLFLDGPEQYVAQAREYQARGIKAYKCHPPGPWRSDQQVHQALRDAMGPDYDLMTDPVSDYTLETAIKVGRHLEKLDFRWFEEPFRDFEIEKYRKLCATLDIAVANAETTRGGAKGVAQLIHANATDIVRADVSWKAGVTGTMKIAHLAEAHGLQCEIHTTTMGPMDIGNLHVSCAIKNCEFFELLVPEESFRFPMKDPWPIDDKGMIHVPEKPGLGIELDWDEIDNTCIEHKKLRAH